MSISGIIRSLPKPVFRGIISLVNNTPPIRRFVSKRTINGYAEKTPARPRAVSMAADYASWPGLTDRRYSGRHLGRATGQDAPAHPPLDDVVKLFTRNKFVPATDTNLLFPFFAQWFTDSFLRTKWEEGETRTFRFNESNHEIDLCSIYGVSESQTTMLREGATGRGRLATQTINGEQYPPPLFEDVDGVPQLAPRYRRKPGTGDDPGTPGLYSHANFTRVFDKWTDDEKRRAFAVGLEHGNSTMANIVMNTLFLREHNRNADLIAAAHPDWDDERVFQTARNVTLVVLLNIVIGDYIVHIAPIDVQLEAVPGMAEQQRWYRNNWMTVEFALLYRWHDLIPDDFSLSGQTYRSDRMLRSHALVTQSGLAPLIREMARQRAGRIGLGNTAEFLLHVKRLSLEMGRACQLASYNAYRRYYRLEPVTSFEALTGNKAKAEALRALYGHIDRLEWFVGIFAETYSDASMMGELLNTMVANDAFTQALTNPLLSENLFNEHTFSPEGFEVIHKTRTLAQVIARNTSLSEADGIAFTVST